MSKIYKDSSSPVRFAEVCFFRDSFLPLYHETMNLIEQASQYHCGLGRLDEKELSEQIAILYKKEIKQLTTRLTRLSSWFFLSRALRSSQITRSRFDTERLKLKLHVPSVLENPSGDEGLPEGFCNIVLLSLSLQSRASWFNEKVFRSGEGMCSSELEPNPVFKQLALLHAAFVAV